MTHRERLEQMRDQFRAWAKRWDSETSDHLKAIAARLHADADAVQWALDQLP